MIIRSAIPLNRVGRAVTVCALACGLGGHLAAEDAPAADENPAGPEGWSYEAKFGAYLSSVLLNNADDSRDASIGGSSETITWLARFNGRATYVFGPHSVQQDLELSYGRQKTEDEDWVEDTDLIDYDGVFRYGLEAPNFIYNAWGADSVFTGPEPDEEPLDTFTAKVSGGFGQLYTDEDDTPWTFEWRAGVRVSKVWGRGLGDDGREAEGGPEAYLRYEATPKEDLTYYLQYEGFSRFDDLSHITNLGTAGLDYKLSDYISLSLKFRAYYETEPDDADANDTGYDELSLRNETLLGLTYEL